MMTTFINSYDFSHRNVTLVDNCYRDIGRNITYAVIVKKLTDLPTYSNPVIYLSNNKFVLKKLTDTYEASKWNAERINNLTGEEFDFICLRQKTILGMK